MLKASAGGGGYASPSHPASHDGTEPKVWYFCDSQQQPQGPFDGTSMRTVRRARARPRPLL